jgi:hypothetical protein
MTRFQWLQQVLEYLGGSRDEAPPGFPIALSNFIFWGIWWASLILVIYVFSGQSSKFIYIDF